MHFGEGKKNHLADSAGALSSFTGVLLIVTHQRGFSAAPSLNDLTLDLIKQ